MQKAVRQINELERFQNFMGNLTKGEPGVMGMYFQYTLGAIWTHFQGNLVDLY